MDETCSFEMVTYQNEQDLHHHPESIVIAVNVQMILLAIIPAYLLFGIFWIKYKNLKERYYHLRTSLPTTVTRVMDHQPMVNEIDDFPQLNKTVRERGSILRQMLDGNNATKI